MEITINELREIDPIKLKINYGLFNYLSNEGEVSIKGIFSSFTECIDKLNSIITKYIVSYLKHFHDEEDWKEFTLTDSSFCDITELSNKCGIYYIEINFNKQLNNFTNKEERIKNVAEVWKNGSEGNCPKINKEKMKTKNK